MPRGATKKLKPEAVKRAADRAEAKSRGEEPTPVPTPLEPPEVKASEGSVMGRPTEYHPSYVTIVRELCENGATESEIAQILGVSTRTIYRWKLEHKDFCLAVSVGKHIADTRVERTLYGKAVGYTYTEQQAVKVKVAKDLEKVEVVEVERHAPPDVQAIQFWLKNRKRETWRDVQQIEHGRPGEFAALNDDELKKWLIENGPQMLTLIVDKDGKTEH